MKKTENFTLSKMLFIQFAGDQPLHAHIVELNCENPDIFAHILPILGSFHIKMNFMTVIFK